MSTVDDGTTTAYRTCPLCEATCGLEITVKDGAIKRIRGDQLDVFSHGYICPKGSTLKQLHEDPDRLRSPLVKRDGKFVPVSWDEAFTEIADRLLPIMERHGRDACAVYIGNPNAHNLAGMLFNRPLIKAIGTTNIYSASTVDQRPKEISNGLMYGGAITSPVPDIDRTDFLLMLGANPFASNGSLATAPDWPGRLEKIVERGGRVVVVDPRRSRTAEAATDHIAIRPAADALFLLSMVHVLFSDDLVDLGTVADYVNNLDALRDLAADFSPEATAAATGVDAATVRALTHDLAAAPSGVVYGRIGTTTTAFGTVTSWLVDAVTILTANLDQPGGGMFTLAAAGASNARGPGRFGRGLKIGRRTTRVRELPESLGELPVVALAEEIETPGDGQIRAMVTVAGNPVLSTPNSERLAAAFDTLEFIVSIDIYVNETTRHADVILPAPSALQKSHYDLALLQLALRNVANYSPPVLPLDEGQLDEWEVYCRLALVLQGLPADSDASMVDDLMINGLISSAVGDEHSPVYQRDPQELLDEMGDRRGPERLLDFMLRTGPYGDGFGAVPDGLTLEVLIAHPHGIDLGPLQPRLPGALRTTDGMIDLAPSVLVDDARRLADQMAKGEPEGLQLIGRRHLRSNNSWMHNVNVLVKGKAQCTLHVHPADANTIGLTDGGGAVVRSRVGEVKAVVEVTDAVRPGVVSLPHGWGHDLPGVELEVARQHAGVNSNVLTDDHLFDPISGTAALNGIPVVVTPA